MTLDGIRDDGGIRREWRHVAAWTLFIVVMTSVPISAGGVLERPFLLDGFLEADKLVHLGLYGVLGWLVVRAVDAEGPAAPAHVAAALAAALAFAAVDEWHQTWIPSRSPQLVDWLADVAGLTVGATVRRARSGADEEGSEGEEHEREHARGTRE